MLRLRRVQIRYEKFTGGVLDTNAYAVRAADGWILFDAPQGVCDWLDAQGIVPTLLLLTHGHYDHVSDAAEAKRRYQAMIGIHRADRPMVEEKDFFARWGFALPVTPVQVDFEIVEGEKTEFLGLSLGIYHVPGHSPGSVCFHDRSGAVLVGGDVLFAGGVGRWDLPGGNGELLIEGIRQKLWALDDATVVLPGHGPSTTIGVERLSNPYVGGI